MHLTREQTVGLGLVTVAGLAAYAGLRRRAERKIACDGVGNSRGGTLASPCPTEGPVDICTGSDYAAWRERLGLQIETLHLLERSLGSAGLLDPSRAESIKNYIAAAAYLVGKANPVWTTEPDLLPILHQIRMGCELLNESNAALASAGYLPVAESGAAKAFATTAAEKQRSPFFWPALAVGVGTAAYFLGKAVG